MKRRTICVLVKSDEVRSSPTIGVADINAFPQINHIFGMISYVRRNEETSCLKIVHFLDEEVGVPSELEANAKSSCRF